MEYFICSTQRSGSSYLCHLLRQAKCFGRPGEIFGKPDHFRKFSQKHGLDEADVPAVVEKLKAEWSTANGVCGFKLHYHQFEWLLSKDSLARLFPQLRFIFIDRADVLEQAVSLMRARMTGVWSTDHQPDNKHELQFDEKLFFECLNALIDEKVKWSVFFQSCEVDVLKVKYEVLEEQPVEEVGRISDFLGVDCNLALIDSSNVAIKKQRDSLSLGFLEAAKKIQRERFFGL